MGPDNSIDLERERKHDVAPELSQLVKLVNYSFFMELCTEEFVATFVQ